MLDDAEKIIALVSGIIAIIGAVCGGVKYIGSRRSGKTPRTQECQGEQPAISRQPQGQGHAAALGTNAQSMLRLQVRVVNKGNQNSRVVTDGIAAGTFLVRNTNLRSLPNQQPVPIPATGQTYLYQGHIPDEFEFIWEGQADLVCSDLRIIWCKVNPWIENHNCEGNDLYLHIASLSESPIFKFIPFRNQGAVLGGMKVCDEQWPQWQRLAEGASNQTPRRYQCQYRFIPHN